MCGIIAIVRRRSERPLPEAEELERLVGTARAHLERLANGLDEAELRRGVVEVAEALEEADRALRGSVGVRVLVTGGALADRLEADCQRIASATARLEAELDRGATGLDVSGLEVVNAALIRLKDACWAIERDRIRTARAVAELAGVDAGAAAHTACTSIQQAFSALDRLEVRGRDSAGLEVLVDGHHLDPAAPAIRAALAERAADPLLRSGSVRVTPNGCLLFVYKAAAEIGELGDNTRVLREAVREDTLLSEALEHPEAQATVLGHTRWASVGIISEANAHPLSSEEPDGGRRRLVTAVLNGDVDNYADLKAEHGLESPPEITTDAKVIPTLVARHLDAGLEPAEAFRRTVASLEGSVAIGATVADEPDRLLLALRGSGQALYVGVAEDAYVVASEPYGVVEETDRYLRMDGETPADAASPTASRGQVVQLSRPAAGSLDGICRFAYDGSELAVTEDDLQRAGITTRDIDRGHHPHYLLKEISESPGSFRKTLRGKLVEQEGGLAVRVGDATLPQALRERLRSGAIRRALVIGQGTAHIAGMSFGHALRAIVGEALPVEALPATELSGFALRADMSDTLVVAISQSGTTTDTNRTVDLVRSRGAAVLAIVNRRNSDLTERVDGVLYTSDGRDVEMSVASTKAFYSQIAAGFLLAIAIADELSGGGRRAAAPGVVGIDESERQRLLTALRDLPDAMERTLGLRDRIAATAQQLAPRRRHWAIVGNGANVIAARELRIKLSELCYKSIACDTTEDKKHIDLSAEPLIVVCAAGLSGSTADDVAKEVAIYRAHKAAPLVIATEGQERFSSALQAFLVPETHPALAFVLAAMAGHLFGYEAALAIDAQARPLREARAAIEAAVFEAGDGEDLLDRLVPRFEPLAARFFDGLRTGDYDGHLEASSAVRVASLFRYALGHVPLESYQVEYGKVGTPGVVIEDLTAALTRAIEELTRPVDAIKHQAKTVTVGISRADEGLLQVPLVQAVLTAGVPREAISYDSLRSIAALDPVVDEVLGYTRYRVEGDLDDGATAVVIDRGGIAREFPSRTDRDPTLRGTKHRVATERRVLVAKGRSDGRPFMIVPEIKDKQTTGLTLVHLRYAEAPPLSAVRSALEGYRNRYSALEDAVTETEPTFREDLLVQIPVADLLSDSIYELADHWRSEPS